MTVERIDNDGPYSPDNCRWATYREQMLNTRRNVTMTLGDKTQTIAEWADELAVSEWLLRSRRKLGWSDERALTEPSRASESS